MKCTTTGKQGHNFSSADQQYVYTTEVYKPNFMAAPLQRSTLDWISNKCYQIQSLGYLLSKTTSKLADESRNSRGYLCSLLGGPIWPMFPYTPKCSEGRFLRDFFPMHFLWIPPALAWFFVVLLLMSFKHRACVIGCHDYQLNYFACVIGCHGFSLSCYSWVSSTASCYYCFTKHGWCIYTQI